MEKPARNKEKNKKSAPKPKTTKKRKSDEPTCSLLPGGLTKKKKQEVESKSVVKTIIESISKALPVKFLRKSSEKNALPMKIETLQTLAPELLPNDTLEIPPPNQNVIAVEKAPLKVTEYQEEDQKPGFKMPRMPIASSEVMKSALEKKRQENLSEEVATNTGDEHDVAKEIAKYVGTLKKISLIAEEFNLKTAKNLKEIVDSVQEDLIKKLDEIHVERIALVKVEKPVQIGN